ARKASTALTQLGLCSSEPVLIPIGGRAQDIAAIMAVIDAGGVAVPFHRKSHKDTRAYLESATGARFVLSTPELEKRSAPSPLTFSKTPPAKRPLLDGAAMITYTSGSTGKPKGVVLSRNRISAKLDTISAAIDMSREPVAVVPLQLQFSFGQWATFLPLMMGGTVYITAGFSADWANQIMRDQPVTHFAAVPTMLRLLLEGAQIKRHMRILTGGEAVNSKLSRAIFQRWPNVTINGIYGLTETGTCDLYRTDRADLPSDDSLGYPAKQIRVMTDPVTSELLIQSPFAMLGYLDMPDLTKETMCDGWIRTGDIAEINKDGTVSLRGRIKDLINRGGNKVAPMEVEAVFADHPEISAVLVTGVPDQQFGESIHMLVVPKNTEAPSRQALIDWAQDRTDRFKLPDVVHYGKELPLGPTGKADRTALRRSILGQSA
ncbi:MAG: AMP-binding protein, partial [Candidatus Puniceispirillum sp.]